MQHPDPLTELPSLERAWMDAWIAKDRATCEGILDDEFILSSARGVLIRKSQWLDMAMSVFECQQFHWDEVLVRPFGSVALVHSTIHQRASVGGRDWSGVFMLTDAWVLRGAQWKVVSRHGTGPLPEAAA
ncbi:MAG: nuclear transport factor 2 family protein [Caldimonas sp.]